MNRSGRMEQILPSIALKSPAGRVAPGLWPGFARAPEFYVVELTYTANSIAGNTLTLRKTAEVIEHGITFGGKSLKDHPEAADRHRGKPAASGHP